MMSRDKIDYCSDVRVLKSYSMATLTIAKIKNKPKYCQQLQTPITPESKKKNTEEISSKWKAIIFLELDNFFYH